MKKKMLVAGTNTAIVKEFIEHSDIYFQSLSTTDCLNDIKLHFELFKPDGCLIFPDSANDNIISRICKLKAELNIQSPFFICAPGDACEIIHQAYPDLAELILKRPVSADNLLLRLLKYFDEPVHKSLYNYCDSEKVLFDAIESNSIGENGTNGRHKKHILIVDDDRTILKMLKSALEENYEVTTMVNGVLVEKFLSAKSVDLIILDYEMPVKTGADVIRELKASDRSNKVPVCFLTGVDQHEKIMEILSLKPDAYMLKPVNMKSFLATVSNLID